ncbi:uroporphyrinogen-III C-methyltransferase [Zoogloea sp.]|uniref:uroporphyrinogen-III C-methyltransferase n=1 Tax=Zoogloea sp. TaxID=49181 RepID=UPI00261DD270|nr:uroporphyrinogen-III C-methyltransferase [Zoogloea sp.]MDD3352148.1 uroporphyrinogen-III C-methyltransferase [Zoogloea sp.]
MSSELPSLPPIEAAQPATAPSSSPSPWQRPSAIIAAVAVALLAWQWIETRSRLADLQAELARRLADGDSVAAEGRALARQAQDSLQDLQGKVGALEARIAESQGQQLALESMYQEFSRTRDDRVLAEVEQALTIATQQLQLAANVQNALAALQVADARLGSLDRPQWLPLRKAIASEIQTLEALPQVDGSGLALKLETLIGRIDGLPLAFEARPKASPGQLENLEPSWLKGLWQEFWSEFSQLLRIERMDRPDPALLAPSNTVFLRENLKLRLLNARLALLSRDGNTFREDMRISAQWLERYFDLNAAAVKAARDDLNEFQKLPVGMDLPTLQASQAALRALLAIPERRAEQAGVAVSSGNAADTSTTKGAVRPARKN